MSESIEVTVQSLQAYGLDQPRRGIAWSGCKDMSIVYQNDVVALSAGERHAACRLARHSARLGEDPAERCWRRGLQFSLFSEGS